MKYCIFTFVFLLSQQIIFAQESVAEKNQVAKKTDGKCYGQCLKASFYKDTFQTYFVYTGDTALEKVNLEEIVTKIIPAKEKWVKKNANVNCLSANPDDCLVWCLETIPEIKETILIVKDTSQTKNYFPKNFTVSKKITDSKFYEREVVCDEKLNKDLIKKIQKALKNLDYFDHKVNGKMDNRLIEAMEDFQNENNIYVGGITMEALDLLKINPND